MRFVSVLLAVGCWESAVAAHELDKVIVRRCVERHADSWDGRRADRLFATPRVLDSQVISGKT